MGHGNFILDRLLYHRGGRSQHSRPQPPIATHYDKWRAELERKFVARGWEKLAFGMNSSVLSPLLRWA
jgi:hypothetical protein